MEEQVADAELDLDHQQPSERDESARVPSVDHAPQCAGCHRRGVALLLLENGKRYCDRCAHEVERLMGIGPLLPGAATVLDDDSDSSELARLETSTDDVAAASHSSLIDPSADPTEDDEPHEETIASPPISIGPPAAAALDVSPSDEDTANLCPAVGSDASSDADSEDAGADEPDLSALVARANQEAARSADAGITRSRFTTPITTKEPLLMERVHEQTRSEISVSAVASLPSDLLAALAAERARLLDQREVLEARFRLETQAIDDRLLHVESLLGEQSESLAS